MKHKKTIHKHWREDLYKWEEKKTFIFIPYYVYSIWKDGKTKIKYSLIKKSKRNAKYIKKAFKTNIYVGKKEFKEVYNNNKYLVPINFVLDLNRD